MKIAKERAKSEFEVQLEAMRLLTEALGQGYIIRGEYTYRGCRFDLAIFNAETRDLICTIEIKRGKGKTRKPATLKQMRRYEVATGKPCIVLTEAGMGYAIAKLKQGLLERRNAST